MLQKALLKHADKFRFALVGGLNTFIDFGVLFTLALFGIDKIVANFFSTSTAFVFSFIANKSYTFKDSSKTTKRQLGLFLSITLSGLWIIQPLIISPTYPILQVVGLNDGVALLVSKLFATATTMVWNYFLYKKFIFKDKA